MGEGQNHLFMTDVMKKTFTWSVVMVTILWSMGVAALVPMMANAANGDCLDLTAGDLIKFQSGSAVYILNADLERMYFPRDEVYKTWYADFSGVNVVPNSCGDVYESARTLPLGVNYRPGSMLVKVNFNPDVYVVEPGNVRTKIASEAVASGLYGSNWATKVRDVSDEWWSNLENSGRTLSTVVPHEGMVVKTAASSQVYLVKDGQLHPVSGDAVSLAQVVSEATLATVPMSSTSVTRASIVANPTQLDSSTTPPTAAGTLAVNLSAATPASQDVPSNVSVEFLRLNVKAGASHDVNVNGLRLTAAGLGTASEIDAVTVYHNGMRYGNARDVDSNKVATINFTSPIVVPKGTTQEIVVKATVTGTGKYALSVASAADVMSSATATGSFPVTGNTMAGTNVTVGQLSFDDEGTLSQVKLGDSNAVLAKFKVTNNNVEDATLKQVIMKRDSVSTASNGSVENLKLMLDGNVVATATGITNNYVTFTLVSPVTILKNGVKSFVVRGNVVDGAGKALTLNIDSAADVSATGNFYKFPTIIDLDDFTEQSVSITAGAVSLEKVNAEVTKLKKDVTDAVLGSFKVTVNSGASAELSTLKLNVTSTNDAAGSQIENVEVMLKNNNTTYDLTSSTGNGVYSNTSMGLVLSSGVVYEFVVRADVKSSATNGDYTVSLADAAGGDLVLKETGNDTTISDITPNSITLAKVTVEGSSVTFSKNALSAAYNAVVGSSDVELFSFNVKASQASDARVSSLTFTDTEANATKAIVSEFKLWKGSQLLKTVSANELASNAITLSDLNDTIPANETRTYKLTASLVNDSNNNTETLNFGLTGYTIVETTKSTQIYDTTIDGDSNGVVTGGTFASARTVTVVGTGSLDVSVDNTVTATRYDTYQLAGATSVPVATFKLRANNEPVKVTELAVVSSANLASSVSRYSLWDGSTMVAETTNVGATTTTLETSFTVTGEKFYQLRVDLQPIGQNQPGSLDVAATFHLASVEAEGAQSGTALAAGDADSTLAAGEIGYEDDSVYASAVSKAMGIVASKISAASLKQSAEGVSLSTKLNSGIAANAAIVELTVPSTVNTNADGSAVKFTLATTTFALEKSSTVTNYTATIERIGGTGSAISANVTGTAPSFALSGTDYQLNPGETVYLLVKVTPTFTASIAGDSSVRLNLNTATGLAWEDRDDATAKTGLRLPGVTTLNGFTISN